MNEVPKKHQYQIPITEMCSFSLCESETNDTTNHYDLDNHDLIKNASMNNLFTVTI